MAQRHVIELLDDIDQTVIQDAGGTHTFALDGRTWEIDLSEANLERLHEALAPFIKAGRRRTSTGDTRTSQVAKGRARSQEETHAIRRWARANGYAVNDRGRIAESIIEAFRASA